MFKKQYNTAVEDNIGNANIISSSNIAHNESSKAKIGAGVKYKGEITGADEVEIEGNVNAKINTNNLIIRGNGKLKGKIVAKNINVWGKLNGNIKISDTLTIYEQGKVLGKIEYLNLQIEKGGRLNGEIKILNQI